MELADAGINAFAHLVRDKEMSDALIASMLKNNVYVDAQSRRRRARHPHGAAAVVRGALSRGPAARHRSRRGHRAHPQFLLRAAIAAARGAQQGDYAILQRSLAKLNAAGARIILGSDTGLEDHLFGYAEQKELELMAQAGMSPSQVIVAATSRAAEYLGLPDAGMLAPGKRADFLVLDANPLDDIRNTRRIAKLYIAGAEVDRAALKAALTKSAAN